MNKLIIAFTTLVAAASAAWAATPSETIAARQANFKVMGRSFKAINDELKNPSPAVDVLRSNAATLSQASGRVAGAFPQGTGPEAGVKTAASPLVWQRSADFRSAAGQLAASTSALDAAARSGDIERIRMAIPAVGGACRTCHETFRVRD